MKTWWRTKRSKRRRRKRRIVRKRAEVDASQLGKVIR